jgi:pimeloyl-ACP methyl ester carboxylesterase
VGHHDALHTLGVGGPYVLVGHAFGATDMRTFADLYRDEVKGLVLIDPDATDAGTPEPTASMSNRQQRSSAATTRWLPTCHSRANSPVTSASSAASPTRGGRMR